MISKSYTVCSSSDTPDNEHHLLCPLYKIGDVVQIKGLHKNNYLAGISMIILSVEDDNELPVGQYIYELLTGDNKIFLYEHCLELVNNPRQ